MAPLSSAPLQVTSQIVLSIAPSAAAEQPSSAKTSEPQAVARPLGSKENPHPKPQVCPDNDAVPW